MPVRLLIPANRHAPIPGREGTVLCGVGGELMEHHRHCLACFCAQHDFRAVDLDIVGCGIRCELALNNLCQRYPVPSTGAQKLVCCRHRANAPVESRYEIAHRSIPNGSLGNYGADGREGVLDTMVELRDQYALTFLCELALGDVKIVAENTGRLSGHLVIEGASHGQDPSNLPVRTDDAEPKIQLIAATNGSVPLGFDPLDVIGMNSVAKIRVTFYSTGLDPEDSSEFRCPRNLARAQVPIP